MKTEQEIIQRLNEVEVEKIKLIGKLELLKELDEKQPQEKVEPTEPSGLD